MYPTYTSTAVELATALHNTGWPDSVTTREDAAGVPVVADVCGHGYRFIITTQPVPDDAAGTVEVLAYTVYDDADDGLQDPLNGDAYDLTGDRDRDLSTLTAALDQW